jgi:hypothetical protein
VNQPGFGRYLYDMVNVTAVQLADLVISCRNGYRSRVHKARVASSPRPPDLIRGWLVAALLIGVNNVTEVPESLIFGRRLVVST